MNSRWKLCAMVSLSAALALAGAARLTQAQGHLDSLERDRARAMLKVVSDEIRKSYYDPKFHGVDLGARYNEASEKIKAATTLGDAYTAIAGMLESLNDSHTFFIPPRRTFRLDYGYQLDVIGNNCFVTQIRPGTDAASKLKVGDQVLAIEGYRTDRGSLWKMMYYFNQLAPRDRMTLALLSPQGVRRDAEVSAKVNQGKQTLDPMSGGGGDIWQLVRESENEHHLFRQRYIESGEDLMIWKMPEFELNDSEVDHLFGIARKHKALILDLRGNPGGLVTTLERVVGNVFDHDVKIADRVGRRELKPQLAKTRGHDIFTGKLIVLVDSGSASAAELFARTVQLEHRGTVLGDLSSGSVMESRYYPSKMGETVLVFYGVAITDADLIMADGKSLEHNGVKPDEVILPTAKELAEGRDPVLSRAGELAGVKIDPAAAGKMFLYEWRPM